ncbi:MAG: hypothetical protein QFB87_05035 [Patescibacteria group bacterium]|nr:hypothetical protein [Patescibacteria group bacterium]
MDRSYWIKQQPSEALYQDLLWSRPENRSFAGKLLVIGGHAQGFTRPAEAYARAEQAGAGTVRVVLPDVLQKTLGRAFLGAEFAPSTPSGSFATSALGEFVPLAAWADAVLLAGDLGRNSETAILLEKFIEQYTGQLTITCDAVDYMVATPYPILQRPDTLLVLSFAQLQKLGVAIKYSNAFTYSMDLLHLIDALYELTKRYKMTIITKHLDTILLAVDGQVVTTKVIAPLPIWRLRFAAQASIWWLQNPTKPLEALTTAIHQALHETVT